MTKNTEKPQKTGKTITLSPETWEKLDMLRNRESRTQSGQVEFLINQAADSRYSR